MSRSSGMLIKPSLEEVKLQAAKIGLPESEAEEFFYHYESNGWKVGKVPMKCWLSALAGWRLRWVKRHVKGGDWPFGGKDRPSGVDKMIWQKEYERVLERMRSLRNGYSENQSWSKADRELFHKLKVRRDELAGKLGIMI